MSFVLRLIGALGLSVLVFVVILVSVLVLTFVVNRGLQLFFRLWGYEMTDFFGALMKQLGFKKIEKKGDKDGA